MKINWVTPTTNTDDYIIELSKQCYDDDDDKDDETSGTKSGTEKTDDPVKLYLREMGTVDLLSREGEIAIAKRIEAGQEAMISGLCESPLTLQAILDWRDDIIHFDLIVVGSYRIYNSLVFAMFFTHFHT